MKIFFGKDVNMLL